MGTKITGVCNSRIENLCECLTNREKDPNFSQATPTPNDRPEKARSGKNDRFETFENNKHQKWQRYDTFEKVQKKLSEIHAKINLELYKLGNYIPNSEFNNKIHPNIWETLKTLKNFVPTQEEIYQNKLNFNKPPFVLKDGTIYKGQWNVDIKRNGFGQLITHEGSLYMGFFSDDRMCGRGRLVDKDGQVYEGSFNNDSSNVYGNLVKPDGTKYIGQWKNGKQEGEGTEYYSGGISNYQGQFKNGEKNGHGTVIWPDKSKYTGQFKNNNIHGVGTYYWSDGREYIGQWENSKMHGKGIFTWVDGKKYEGDYINDKKEGYGKYYWNADKHYEGNWLNGVRHGEGVLYQNGKFYKGIWQHGKLEKPGKGKINENASKIAEDVMPSEKI
jgi:hypothetical protein